MYRDRGASERELDEWAWSKCERRSERASDLTDELLYVEEADER